MSDNKKPERVTELEFGREMLLWDYKGHYPLEAISIIIFTDQLGEFYLPGIRDYCYHEVTLVAGSKDGYTSREQALRCAGRCWDKALAARNLPGEQN
jgi:hypothetical protein